MHRMHGNTYDDPCKGKDKTRGILVGIWQRLRFLSLANKVVFDSSCCESERGKIMVLFSPCSEQSDCCWVFVCLIAARKRCVPKRPKKAQMVSYVWIQTKRRML